MRLGEARHVNHARVIDESEEAVHAKGGRARDDRLGLKETHDEVDQLVRAAAADELRRAEKGGG